MTRHVLVTFQRAHPDVFAVYNNPAASNTQPRFQKETSVTVNARLSGKRVLGLITEYIIECVCPFRTVETAAFSKLVHGLTNTSVQIPSRRTVAREIESLFEEKVKELQGFLGKADFVATTADIWTGFKNRRAFMGMTVTYLDEALDRKSFTLSCRLFEGSHTFDKIGEILQEEHAKFGLYVPKLVATVTDNASNFKKAFKEYGIEATDLIKESDESDETDEIDEIDMEDSPSANSAFLETDESNDGVALPPQLNCAAHTLSLVSVNGLKNAENESASFKKGNRSLMGKVTALWNKISRSPAASETARKFLKKCFPTPCATRWNSLHDALEFIHKQEKVTIDQIFEALDLPKLTPSDYLFLQEMVATMKPVATTLDHLQAGKETSALGFLIPRIYELNDRLASELQDNHLVYCKPLLECLKKQLQQRYGALIDVDLSDKKVQECVLATVSHPKFKLYWCPDSEVEEKVKQLAIAYVEKNQPINPTNVTEREPDSEFQFLTKRQRPSLPENRGLAQLQLMQYFANNRCDLDSLSSYLVVKKMFQRFNTCQTSSADVERLFSIAGIIQAGRRARLSPDHLQNLLFLKSALSKQ